ncbi:hypothetical protein M422DRAFT_167900 [Sphaerobolus stellatus SS14]|uniref:Unplaced genomic scaffold SPHSTscaffold_41, whole genome shotgun sequence n=1 Tax=Sphaerobolus stellatus (strain SS14) TaxID=990650 RepID=A0A0C9VCG1_SPHS4|nr:hypothetical protein M422DRAFT_167900 [Sphaerobolus stellatus SS14]
MHFDFVLTHVLSDILARGIKYIVVSYNIACKYHINFRKHLVNKDCPLMTLDKRDTPKTMDLIWLGPKFHLASHIDGCADKVSFNRMPNVG